MSEKQKRIDLFCLDVAKSLFNKHKPTKLSILKYASVDRTHYLGFPCPYALTEDQINTACSLGVHEEAVGYEIFIRILALVFPEFDNDLDFLSIFARDYKFWGLNLLFYKRFGKTIFEDIAFPKFDWGSCDNVHKKIINDFMLGNKPCFEDDELLKQENLLKMYIDKINEITNNALK